MSSGQSFIALHARAGSGVLSLRTSLDSATRPTAGNSTSLHVLMASFGPRSDRVPEQRGHTAGVKGMW